MKKLLNQKESFIQAQGAVLTDAEPEQLQRAGSSTSLNSVSRGSVGTAHRNRTGSTFKPIYDFLHQHQRQLDSDCILI